MGLELHADNPQPVPVFEPAGEAAHSVEIEAVSLHPDDPAAEWPNDTGIQILRATRSWIQYGTVGFAVFCILIGAVEALFGR